MCWWQVIIRIFTGFKFINCIILLLLFTNIHCKYLQLKKECWQMCLYQSLKITILAINVTMSLKDINPLQYNMHLFALIFRWVIFVLKKLVLLGNYSFDIFVYNTIFPGYLNSFTHPCTKITSFDNASVQHGAPIAKICACPNIMGIN